MSTEESGHTPTPWLLDIDDRQDVLDRGGELLATAYPMNSGAAASANAAFIVTAVNNHEALVAALREARQQFYEDRHSSMNESEFNRSVAFIDAALQSATGAER